MHSEFVIPKCFLADDATSADQIALSVREAWGGRVITTDAETFCQRKRALSADCVTVINTGTRAVSGAEAEARNRRLAACIKSTDGVLPIVQIDSRLRGVGNALRALYAALDFDFAIFVPAEPELGRLTKNGTYYHIEEGARVPFHESGLADSLPMSGSDLRKFAAAELGIAPEEVLCIDKAVVSMGGDAIASAMAGLRRKGKCLVIPDVTAIEHFEAIASAQQQLGQARVLIAGSRTFLRSCLGPLGSEQRRIGPTEGLAGAIDRERRGAPLAIVCSLESSTSAQIEYVRRAIGPNLVSVIFDSDAISAGEARIESEIERVRRLLEQSLKAMRPVLLHSARVVAPSDSARQQKHLDAISKVVAGDDLIRHVTALFISGGQTAEVLRSAMNIPEVEIKGAFEPSVPWGVPTEGPLQHIPIVTKGGRLGNEKVLFEFFEQGHPLPRSNILPVITPLNSRKEVDETSIEKLIHYLVGLGTTDVFAVGNAGEFRFLPNERRLQTLEAFARKARGKLRVFGGITGDSADETRKNYEAAGKLGIYAAVVMPLYFLKSSDEIVTFVESLPSKAPRLPLVLYNNPERTKGQNISFEAVEALPFPVVAIKDSSGDLARLDRYMSIMPVYEGQQRQFWEGYQHGVRGTIGIIGHASPLPNEFYSATMTDSRREEIGRAINDLSKKVKQGGAEVAAYKFLLSLMGVTGDTVASTEAARDLTGEQEG